MKPGLRSWGWSEHKTSSFPSQHLERGHALDAEADAGIRNLDVAPRAGCHFMGDNGMLAGVRLSNQVVSRYLKKVLTAAWV